MKYVLKLAGFYICRPPAPLLFYGRGSKTLDGYEKDIQLSQLFSPPNLRN